MVVEGANFFQKPVECNGHPKWFPPRAKNPDSVPKLRINNTLTGNKDEFVPINGKQVLWYNCGPTVYDYSHVGHARTYLTFDILRRLMEDYFGYEVVYHLNITDIDDKIILRARQNELLRRYSEKHTTYTPEVEAEVLQACKQMEDSIQAKIEQATKELEELQNDEKNGKRVIEAAAAHLEGEKHKLSLVVDVIVPAVQKAIADKNVEELIAAGRDALAGYLDGLYKNTVTDHSIFDAHSRKFEAEFMKDMDALGIRPPDILTRVTEYLPKIISFVEKIVNKGLAYESNGSVYIDLQKLKESHDYRKLSPSKEDTNANDLAESEGALGGATAAEKRNINDFALWKASKEGEPSWDSPWGQGRPGWHIECSVVASDILGESIDMHSGGIDLKFPHHDNELAQSEACFGNQQWVNYFMHAGHLHIKGLKMSKSLKNFITIQQALENNTARQIRIMFLLQPWDKGMNFSDQAVEDAKKKEATLKHFFGKLNALAREDVLGSDAGVGWVSRNGDQSEFDANKDILNKLLEAQREVHEALCDNFNTVAAMEHIMNLVSVCNVYLQEQSRPSVYLVAKVGRYLTKLLKAFGVVGNDDMGFEEAGQQDSSGALTKLIDTFSEFRHQVRSAVLEKQDASTILAVSDKVRDEDLVSLGIRLEDRSGQSSVWSLDSPEVLLKEVTERKEREVAARAAKMANKMAILTRDLDKLVLAKKDAKSLFLDETDKYSEFDEAGLPTKDASGEPLSKKLVKKLKSQQDKHAKTQEDLKKKNGGDLDSAIAAIEEQIKSLST